MIFAERTALAPGYEISRVIRGAWQLAGGHGPVDRAQACADFVACFDAGITVFDCADIYTGVEDLIGQVRERLAQDRGPAALDRLKVHTKCVPDLSLLPRLTRQDLRAGVERSLRRLRASRLDLVQFHWWDYAVPGWLEAGAWLAELQTEGLIDRLGGTNFDAARLAAFARTGVPLVSMQSQYSLIDERPAGSLAATAAQTRTGLIAYGVLAGGFLSERWLGAGAPAEPLENRSLVKYRLIIEEAGGWDWFQAFLRVLDGVARRHGADIPAVAARAVLDRPGVAAVILGARNVSRLSSLERLASLRLDESDRRAIADARAQGRPIPGEAFELERDRSGPHGRIMKYELNG